jgi:hypothetical protein
VKSLNAKTRFAGNSLEWRERAGYDREALVLGRSMLRSNGNESIFFVSKSLQKSFLEFRGVQMEFSAAKGHYDHAN